MYSSKEKTLSLMRMYGLLLENIIEYLQMTFGPDKSNEILRIADIKNESFQTKTVYSETIIPNITAAAIQVLDITEEELFERLGAHFVKYLNGHGYDQLLMILGRHLRDFLNGLDNLHEYLKYSYPCMQAPSFICENETSQGLKLHYRSKRHGFLYYTVGQIKEVAKRFYNMDIMINLIDEISTSNGIHVIFDLIFDNSAFVDNTIKLHQDERHLPISGKLLFEIFPFCLIINSDMIIVNAGNSLLHLIPDLIGNQTSDIFSLVRPLINLNFHTILNKTNNVFEFLSIKPILMNTQITDENKYMSDDNFFKFYSSQNLKLKGQMIYLESLSKMIYLGSPVMLNINWLTETGLYINDLSMHDFSRDCMLAGTQQSVELKLAYEQERQKSEKIEESMHQLDIEMKRTDEILYQMIPQQVADRLRAGEDPVNTCEMLQCVSILFSDVVSFTKICSHISPMEVVSMLNKMYSIFDDLCEKNKTYKVETIGDAYMVVAGAPVADSNHAIKVCDMALDMLEAITYLKDSSTGSHLCIRIGVHSGTAVAGIVGHKMPRYCLFGNSVSISSKLEQSSESMKIHISESTKEILPEKYMVVQKGNILHKGDIIKTYWLEFKEGRHSINYSQLGKNFKYKNFSNDFYGDRIRTYSPITMEQVAMVKRSQEIMCSPNKLLRSEFNRNLDSIDKLSLSNYFSNDKEKITEELYCSYESLKNNNSICCVSKRKNENSCKIM